MHKTLWIEGSDSSAVGESRRLASRLAHQLAFPPDLLAKIEVVVTEMMTNLVKHAKAGQLIISMQLETKTLDLISIDRGPGMANPDRCMQDGYSSAGTAGGGLGAIVRLSHTFDIFSKVDEGTVLVASFCGDKTDAPGLTYSSIVIPFPGEYLSGDAIHAINLEGKGSFLVIDGLGHGEEANRAAVLGVDSFVANSGREPDEVLQCLHRALGGGRGAAAAIVTIDLARGEGYFSGVGNIAATLQCGETVKGFASYDGIVGHNAHKFVKNRFEWGRDSILTMHSDGLSARTRIDQYPGLAFRHPALIGGVLFRDARRIRDDAAVLVCKNRSTMKGLPC